MRDWTYCSACRLGESAAQHALLRKEGDWRGSEQADVLILGEAPGQAEDVLGVPFTGLGGKLLMRILASTLFAKDPAPRVALTNLLGCRPCDRVGGPQRRPFLTELEACAPRLRELLVEMHPKVVVLLGRFVHAPARKVLAEAGWTGLVFATESPASFLREDPVLLREVFEEVSAALRVGRSEPRWLVRLRNERSA